MPRAADDKEEFIAYIRAAAVKKGSSYKLPSTGKPDGSFFYMKAIEELGIHDEVCHFKQYKKLDTRKVQDAKAKLDADASVDAKLVERGIAPLQRTVSGARVGNTEAANLVGVVTTQSKKQEGRTVAVTEALALVNRLLVADKKPTLVPDRQGFHPDLLLWARFFEVIDQNSHLRRISRQADGTTEAYEALQRMIAEAKLAGLNPPELITCKDGTIHEMLTAALFFNVVKDFVYTRKLAQISASNKMLSDAASIESRKLFEALGNDKAMTEAEADAFVADKFPIIFPELCTSPPGIMPLVQVLQAKKTRGDTIDGKEVSDQFNRDTFTRTWNTQGKRSVDIARMFEHFILYETTNPPNSFLVEAAMHRLLRLKGFTFPTTCMFSRVGSGGFNLGFWEPGLIYGTYIIKLSGGVPSTWTRKSLDSQVIGQSNKVLNSYEVLNALVASSPSGGVPSITSSLPSTSSLLTRTVSPLVDPFPASTSSSSSSSSSLTSTPKPPSTIPFLFSSAKTKIPVVQAVSSQPLKISPGVSSFSSTVQQIISETPQIQHPQRTDSVSSEKPNMKRAFVIAPPRVDSSATRLNTGRPQGTLSFGWKKDEPQPPPPAELSTAKRARLSPSKSDTENTEIDGKNED